MEENEREYYCPLLKRVIDFAYCYDINMVAFGFIKVDAIEDLIDRKIADPICTDCEKRQMRG